MISFKEFLESQEGRLRAEKEAAAEAWRKWADSIIALSQQIEGWIKDSDPHGLVTLKHKSLDDLDEEGFLRNNNLPLFCLTIQIGDREVVVRPTGRDILGPRWKPAEGQWLGRVDMMVIGESERYQLFRFVHQTKGEAWFLRDPKTLVLKSLDRDSFDAALVSLFS